MDCFLIHLKIICQLFKVHCFERWRAIQLCGLQSSLDRATSANWYKICIDIERTQWILFCWNIFSTYTSLLFSLIKSHMIVIVVDDFPKIFLGSQCNEGFVCAKSGYCIGKSLLCTNQSNCGPEDSSDEQIPECMLSTHGDIEF